MKSFVKIIMLFVMSVLPFSPVLASGDDPVTVTLVPKKKGLGDNLGGTKSPVENGCPLTVYYAQSLGQIEFENPDISALTFAYSVYDGNATLLQSGNILVNGNSIYMLSLSCMTESPAVIQIEIGGVLYEGSLNGE